MFSGPRASTRYILSLNSLPLAGRVRASPNPSHEGRGNLSNSLYPLNIYGGPVPATKLILIRHGRTDWSDQKRYCGWSDVPLNDRGRDQAGELGKKMQGRAVHKIYSSTMKRAVQSAGIVFTGRPVELVEELREMSFGLWDGLTHQEIMAQDSQAYSQWLENPLCVTPPEGENLSALARRVREKLREILEENHSKTIALFTHGGPIKIILCDIQELGLENIWKVQYDWAQACVIDFASEKRDSYSGEWKGELWEN